MTDQTASYNVGAIRELLLAAFTPQDLRRFCQDRLLFQPIVVRFGPGHGLDDMVDEVIDYCRTRLLWDDLLADVKEANPLQYARFEPALYSRTGQEEQNPPGGRRLSPVPWPKPDTPAGPIRARWALLVGVNHFIDPAIPDLRFCVNDVVAMEAALQARGYTTVALHDAAAEEHLQPTRDNVEGELARLCRVAGPDDLLWVHFSCHGKTVNGVPVLITRETRRSTLAEKALPLSWVERQMRQSKSRRLVLTFDACHTGVEIGRDLADPAFIRNAYELAEGFALLAASSSQQVAQEWEEKEHGVFTYYLLDGLSGSADRDGKGFVTVDDLKLHVLDGLRRWNVEHGGLIQEPTARTEGLGDMILAEAPPAGLPLEPDLAIGADDVPFRPDPDLVAAYLEVVRGQCGRLETRPYRQLSELRGAPPGFSLLEDEGRPGIYVPLRFDLHPSRADLESRLRGKETELGAVERDLSRTDIDLAEVLGAPGHVVLIGAAGSGKTTVLRLVASGAGRAGTRDLARGELGLEEEAGRCPCPSSSPCATSSTPARPSQRPTAATWRACCASWTTTSSAGTRDCVPNGFVSGLVRAGRAWLLLDALDEVADFDHRIAMRQVIEAPGRRLSREPAAGHGARGRLRQRRGPPRRALPPGHGARPDPRAVGADGRAPLRRAGGGSRGWPPSGPGCCWTRIDGAPLLQEMVKTPLMVWTATLIHYADRELPEQRAELYGAYVDVLLGERLHEEESAEAAQRLREERWPLEDRRLYLTYAAYQVHRGGRAGAERRPPPGPGRRRRARPGAADPGALSGATTWG